jgi:putative membrane protein
MLRVIIGLPLLVILVVFALSNTDPVRLGIWPTDYTVQVPLSIAVLAAAAVAFLLGGLVVWMGELGQRRRARRAEDTVRVLEDRLEELKARLARPLAPPP